MKWDITSQVLSSASGTLEAPIKCLALFIILYDIVCVIWDFWEVVTSSGDIEHEQIRKIVSFLKILISIIYSDVKVQV